MALIHGFKETIAARVARDPAFVTALRDEATILSLNGETQAARLILRDFVKGFRPLFSSRKEPS